MVVVENTARQDREIVLSTKQNRLTATVSLNREFRNESGVRIDNQANGSRLHDAGLSA